MPRCHCHRWVKGGWEAVEAAGRIFNSSVVKDVWGRPVLLFRNEFALNQVGWGSGGCRSVKEEGQLHAAARLSYFLQLAPLC